MELEDELLLGVVAELLVRVVDELLLRVVAELLVRVVDELLLRVVEELLLIVNKSLAACLVLLEIGLPEEEELFVTFFVVVFGIFINLSL